MENDFEFAGVNGKKTPYGDYNEILKKWCKEHNTKFDIEKFEDKKYKKWILTSGSFRGEGLGLTTWKAHNIASYNLYKQLMLNPNQEQNHTTNSPPIVVKLESKKISINIQNTSCKYEEPRQSQSTQDLIITKNQYTACLLSKEIGLSDSNYLKFSHFLNQLNQSGFPFHVLGSYNTKSIRITKPIIDIILEDANVIEFLNKLKSQMNFEIENQENQINLYFQKLNEQKILKFQSIPLQVSIYLVGKSSSIHKDYMIQYQQKFQQLNFSTQSLMLTHQWKDDSQINVPNELLDFLVVQVTNQFQYLNSPYQVLRQIVYLLQHGVLEEMRDYPNIELNPFLQSINDYYIETARKISFDQLKIIREETIKWDSHRYGDWLSKFQ